MKFSKFCYAKVYAVQISAKKLINAEPINILVIQDGGRRILDFQKFAFLIIANVSCISTFPVQFGDNRSTHAKWHRYIQCFYLH